MSKHLERMNQSLSATVRMKTGTDVFSSSIVEFYTRNISLIVYSYLEKQRMRVNRNNSTQIAKKSNFKHYLDIQLKLVIIKTIVNYVVAFLRGKTHVLQMRKEKTHHTDLPY